MVPMPYHEKAIDKGVCFRLDRPTSLLILFPHGVTLTVQYTRLPWEFEMLPAGSVPECKTDKDIG
jgi:hypothetical protein